MVSLKTLISKKMSSDQFILSSQKNLLRAMLLESTSFLPHKNVHVSLTFSVLPKDPESELAISFDCSHH